MKSSGWLTHSLQLDGLLVEAALRAGGGPPIPLEDNAANGAPALSIANEAIVTECGIEVKMTKKNFHRSTLKAGLK